MIITQGIDVPFLLQLINGDSSFLTTATVVYSVYNSDGTNKVVEEQETVYDSILGGYYDELDVESNWSDQSAGNYLLVWNITNADSFPSTSVENISVVPGMIDGEIDFTQALKIILAATAGETDRFPEKTIYYKNVDGTKNVITATLDRKGNRTSITFDLS